MIMSEIHRQTQLIHFLQAELAIPEEAIAIGLRQSAFFCDSLPMILWQYGLISLSQLETIWDWLDATV
jgi:hypothetical protein